MYIEKAIRKSIALKEAILQDEQIIHTVYGIIDHFVSAFQQGNKVLLCGNGGSAADAQHIAGELSGKLYLDRAPLHAEALHVNTSYLTAVANDISYDQVYARAVEAKGRLGDILLCLSTSGNSTNVVEAARIAQAMGIKVIGFTGQSGGKLEAHCDHVIKIPSDNVARIQENHILLGHLICENVEKQLFKI